MESCSVIIIAYNSSDFLPACLASVFRALEGMEGEVIVLDNGSSEPISEKQKALFPRVIWLDSKENLGFGKGCNAAVQKANGHYLFFVNPDTIVSKDSFRKMLHFMEAHKESGTVGCRILNDDGSLQWACRRKFPTPLGAIFKTVGLAHLFPKSKFFASYNMTYLDPEETVEVDAISGSFFCIRRELFSSLGGFDPDYFMYGEDLDLCLRVQQAGFRNYYAPVTNILHFKGRSCKTRRFRSYIDFYQAMLIFAKKHRRFHLPYLIIEAGIFFAACIGIFSRLLPHCGKALPDLLCLILPFLFFSEQSTANFLFPVIFILGTLFSLLFSGEYAQSGLQIGKRILAPALFSIIFSLTAFFVGIFPPPFIAFSLLSVLCLHLWRRIFFWLSYFYRIFAKKRHRAILIGGGEDPLSRWFNRYSLIAGVEILGCVTNFPEKITEENREHLLGGIKEIEEICKRSGCREVWFYSNESGMSEESNLDALYALGLKVFLLVGGKSEDFALVDLEKLA